MSARSYAIAVITVAAALFFVVVGTNLLIDPQEVFGTGVVGRSVNANDRYARLLEYRANPGGYDSVMFGSSRAFVMPFDELSRQLGGARLANFAAVGGTLSDHVPTLEYLLRDKTARGERLRNVVLELDVDALGNRPFTNQGLQYVLPPAISGESEARFWWKLLTSIQLKAWQSTLRGSPGAVPLVTGPAADATSSLRRIVPDLAQIAGVSRARAQTSQPAASTAQAGRTRERITERADFVRQLKLLEHFVALCRRHELALIVMAVPIGRASADRLDEADLLKAIDQVSDIVPLWDFTVAKQAIDDPDRWTDGFHFRPELALMMVRRVFAAEVPQEWRDFGVFKAAKILSGP